MAEYGFELSHRFVPIFGPCFEGISEVLVMVMESYDTRFETSDSHC